MKSILLIFGLVMAISVFGSAGKATNVAQSDLESLIWPEGVAAHDRSDTMGPTLEASRLRDRLAVVGFVGAGCTITCVARTMDLDRLARGLPANLRERVAFLALGTDPAADGDGGLRAFAEAFVGTGSPLRFLPSSRTETEALTRALGYPASLLPEPPPTILLFDRRGRIAMTYGGPLLDAARLQRDIAVLDGLHLEAGQPAQGAAGASL